MSESEPAITQKDLSYLQLYRMHRQWQPCADVIYSLEHTNEAYQPINQLRQKIRSHHKEEPTWPTAAQIDSVQRHSARCERLMLQLEALDMPPLAFDHRLSKHLLIDAQLLERLKHTSPVTVKEQDIANVLALKSTWQAAFYAVIQTSDIDPLVKSNTTPDYLETMFESSDAETSAYNNPRNIAIAAFSIINGQLSKALYSTDPDVFYEAQMALEQSHGLDTFGYFTFKNIGQKKIDNPFIEYISPGEVLMQMAGLHDGDWFDLVIQHATKLYLCELGADCGPDSELALMYCFAGLTTMDPESCDLDYPTFLQSHYLNDNQWDDVQFVLSMIRTLYGQA